MSAIKCKDTKPELLVRKFLFGRGFRYRLNHPRLPGHPDIVLRKYRTVIFVNGCFWHGHQECKYFVLPKTNVEFWSAKIERNILSFLKRMWSFGVLKSKGIEKGMLKNNVNWHQWDGIVLPFGNVS